MRPCFGMSLDPAFYASQLVQRLGFKEPPISEKAVLDDLHLSRRYFQGFQFFPTEVKDKEEPTDSMNQSSILDRQLYRQDDYHRRHRPKPVDAALHGNTVWVDSEFPNERQRAAICHEVGHNVLPGHQDLSYVKDGCIIDLTTGNAARKHKRSEEEANRFSAHLLMPSILFFEDMNDLPFGIQTIETLARRYITSIESTAIHYVSLATSSCALVMIESLPKGVVTKTGSRLRVRYSKASPSFEHFIRPGIEVPPDSLIAQASLMGSGLDITGKVPGWVLGLRPERRLVLHCRPWGEQGDVLVLVEEPQGNQGRLF